MTVPSEEENNRKERKNIMIHDEPEILRMSEVQLREVDWLWYPYIPFGKLAILQGDPGEGKTTLALRLAAACSAGKPMPGMKPLPPFNVIYQTAKDGLEDTVKPALPKRTPIRTGSSISARIKNPCICWTAVSKKPSCSAMPGF